MASIYVENGFLDREDYLKSLSGEYDVSMDIIYAISEILGDEEDFDGLISALNDQY